MAKRGRTPKPVALKVLAGNPGHRPLTRREPQPVRGIPPRPDCLDRIARQEWERVTVELDLLGLVTRVDMAVLASYCQAFSRWYQAETLVQRKGLTLRTKGGLVKRRPELGIAHESMRLMAKFAAEFGLTPSSRLRLAVEPTPRDPKDTARFFS